MNKAHIFLKRNASTILTCIGAVGVIGTAILSSKAATKASKLVEKATEEKGEELTKVEYVRAAAPSYISTVIVGASTIACIFGANVLNKQKQAALMSAYALVNSSYSDYKRKLKELYGQEAHDNIIESLAIEKAQDVQINAGFFDRNCNLEFDSEDAGETRLFYDIWSERYFESTIEKVTAAEYHLNRNFVLRGYAFLGEFYEFLGLEETEFGNTAGWAVCDDEIYWIDFHHKKAMLDDTLECYIIDIMYDPTVGFLDW